MWLLEDGIAELRKTYSISIRLLHLDGDASASRRTGKIVRTDSPERYPLSQEQPATVEVEYSDRGVAKRRVVPVKDLNIMEPSNGCHLLVFEGQRKGIVVKHAKTLGDLVRVKDIDGRGKPFQISKTIVCKVSKEL